MEESPEDERELQSLAEEAVLRLKPTEDVLMGDVAAQDIADFRAPEEPKDPKRPEPSDAPGVQVRGSQFRGGIAGAVLPAELVTAGRAKE
eukprot:11665675-Alexandrium_andersonii.AAC.1